MMSLETIRELSREAAVKARRDKSEPFTVEAEDIADWKYKYEHGTLRLPFPNLGTHVPKGWQRTERDPLFVDSSGFGSDSEPALSVSRLLEALTPGKAYAITETGQFQLYIAEFEREERTPIERDAKAYGQSIGVLPPNKK